MERITMMYRPIEISGRQYGKTCVSVVLYAWAAALKMGHARVVVRDFREQSIWTSWLMSVVPSGAYHLAIRNEVMIGDDRVQFIIASDDPGPALIGYRGAVFIMPGALAGRSWSVQSTWRDLAESCNSRHGLKTKVSA
jgi:hypothetical protein